MLTPTFEGGSSEVLSEDGHRPLSGARTPIKTVRFPEEELRGAQ
jgi:hypothetical protein